MAEGMLRNIAAGETFIVWDDGTPAATITVDRWANPDLWTPGERAEPALYAHKVTVARAYAGQALGVELLDWAGTRTANSGLAWLRVDVWTTNLRVHAHGGAPAQPVWGAVPTTSPSSLHTTPAGDRPGTPTPAARAFLEPQGWPGELARTLADVGRQIT